MFLERENGKFSSIAGWVDVFTRLRLTIKGFYWFKLGKLSYNANIGISS